MTSTAVPQTPTPGRAPSPLVRRMQRLEEDRELDGVVGGMAAVASVLVRSPAAVDALRGTWLAHALHPVLTDFPLGSWMSASLLDLVGGEAARPAARRLVGFGLLVSVPTFASGLVEWESAHGAAARRVGVVHAAVNVTATSLYGLSWVARRRARQGAGVSLGIAGGLVAIVGGYLGGHLTLVRKVGTADPSFTAGGHGVPATHASAQESSGLAAGGGPQPDGGAKGDE